MNLFFFVRSFNDVDHITPLLDKLMYDKRHSVRVICIRQTFEYSKNHNIAYLNKKYGLTVEGLFEESKDYRFTFYSFILKEIENGVFKKTYLKYLSPLKKKIVTYCYRKISSKLLNKVFFSRPDAIIFDWSSAYVYPQRLFVLKANELNIPTFCLPHGILLYTNKYPTKKQVLLTGRADLFYDHYLFYGDSTQYLTDRGVPNERINLIGSMRYSAEWINKYKYLISNSGMPSNLLNANSRVKLVFFLSQNIYNVDESKVIKTLIELSKVKDITVVIKPHTRGMPTKFISDLGFYIDYHTSSVVLSDWCDGAILYGSSIGLQILHDRKILIYPNYIDTNSTIFDQYRACLKVESIEELINVIENMKNGIGKVYSELNVEALFEDIVYAGREDRSVISNCLEYIENHKS